MNILLGITGSVAAVLTHKLVWNLKQNHKVKIVVTDTVQNFIDLSPHQEVYNDRSEWDQFNEVGDPILHIELRKWADLFLIAPCTMNTLAKITNGLCDNLLTNTVRAWDSSKPFFIAPACNTHMWDHPITTNQINFAQEDLGIQVIPPTSKTLACGDTGIGAMADIDTILSFINMVK